MRSGLYAELLSARNYCIMPHYAATDLHGDTLHFYSALLSLMHNRHLTQRNG